VAVLSTAPTVRAAAILSLVALSALVLPLTVVIAAALILLAAIGADAWTVRDEPVIERTLGHVLSRGVPSPLQVRAIAADGRRVLLRQPATPALGVDVEGSRNELTGWVLPRRRGRHELPAVASASLGPLGLARVHHRPGPVDDVRVYPDLAGARALLFRMRSGFAGHPGRMSRGPLGLGTDFESVREYSPNDDVRQLNWRATARLGRPMSNQYRVERDRDVVCVLDSGRLMGAPVGARTMLDAALDAVTVIALAADELGDRCGAIAFDASVRRSLAPRHRGGRDVIEALFELEATSSDSDFELAFARVGSSRRALVLVLADLIDEAAARSLIAGMTMLARRHAVVVASVLDPALEQLTTARPDRVGDVAAAVVAADVLEARARAALRLRQAGAEVLEARANELAGRCLEAYLRAKSRARL
jgi:uncharacterized protein (DUF58 family)